MTQEHTGTSWLTDASRRTIAAVAGTTAAALFATMGYGLADAHTTVTVSADGQTQKVSMWGKTVTDALSAADIHIGPHDQVTPPSGTRLRDGEQITVERAQRYTVSDGINSREFWSTADNYKSALAALEAAGREGALSASRSEDREALPALTAVGETITVRADGKDHPVTTEANTTVPQALQAAGVTVSPIDRVFLTTDGGRIVIEVTRVTRGEVTNEETVDFETIERDTDELYEGETRVVAEGSAGKIVTTRYQEKRGDHTVVDVVVKKTETKPENRIVEHGTKERPALSVASGSTGSPVTNADLGSAPDGVWAALAQCESGGNPATNTGNGYYGLYQFSLGTWQSVGGTGLPSEATAAEQTMRAQILQQRAGWGQWPHCARQLGLI